MLMLDQYHRLAVMNLLCSWVSLQFLVCSVLCPSSSGSDISSSDFPILNTEYNHFHKPPPTLYRQRWVNNSTLCTWWTGDHHLNSMHAISSWWVVNYTPMVFDTTHCHVVTSSFSSISRTLKQENVVQLALNIYFEGHILPKDPKKSFWELVFIVCVHNFGNVCLRFILKLESISHSSYQMTDTHLRMQKSAKLPQQKALTAMRTKVSVCVRVILMTKSGPWGAKAKGHSFPSGWNPV